MYNDILCVFYRAAKEDNTIVLNDDIQTTGTIIIRYTKTLEIVSILMRLLVSAFIQIITDSFNWSV